MRSCEIRFLNNAGRGVSRDHPNSRHRTRLNEAPKCKQPAVRETTSAQIDALEREGTYRMDALAAGHEQAKRVEWHRHRLIGTQASCSWTMTANGRRGQKRPRRIRQKRTNTAANSDLSSHPQDDFTAVVSVFQAHLPEHDLVSHAKPLDWKSQGRGIRQYRPAS